ncbi:hypothetical protein PHSY_000742 [Pseudozyma hubeiensis SY62]|uniref:Zn(2)-C6 fungal-type domain-containing protein n=1 Tax=Pseudozyma hubeiensis (strain SY62) TaxID=1305764 RepID=R9NX68_PSEHS|nr:hypothetical protein PHSY_000742 [Pseudozyma hubeiensis SY62]GAC93179.1 hypothetical protein PHSY_000742 [Pseudozyma hubeiensis SY62]
MKVPKAKHSPSSSNSGFSADRSQTTASTFANKAGHPYPSKILACVACRNSKVKCISDSPEHCKRCLEHGLTCIRPEYQRLKKAKAKLARFQEQTGLPNNDKHDAEAAFLDEHQEETDELLGEQPVLPQEATTTLFSNASYGKSSQLLHSLHSVRADVGQDWDPVSAGIMDLETSKILFDTFMLKLEALLSFFDPRIHTYQYIRTHSSLLFTTMCWLAATVSELPAALRVSNGLKAHIDNVLLPAIYCQNLRSVEIVQGFLMLAAYISPTRNPSEDRSWTLLGHAIRVATDLDMHSRVLSTSQQNQTSSGSAHKDGSLDEHSTQHATAREKDAQKQHDVLHQRNRERAWMHVWLHEASSSQYTGRVSLLSKDPIVESSRGWHLHPEALHTDVVFVALIELRSQLSQNKELFRLLSGRCAPISNNQPSMPSQASTAAAELDSSWIRHYLDRCHRDLSSWEERWVVNPSHSSSHPRPLRFELGSLYICYARMQLLSLPLQWPTLQPSMATRIVSDLHSVSIKYLEDFLDRTSPQRLAHSYNSICVTATYAVVIALKLTKLAPAYSFIHSSKIIKLVTRVSDYLRKAGNWTPHQNGSSLSYAKYIDQLLDMESKAPGDQTEGTAQSNDRSSGAQGHSRVSGGPSVMESAGDSHANGDVNVPSQRKSVPNIVGASLSAADTSLPPPSDRYPTRNQPSTLQRTQSHHLAHPLSSPRTIYSATPASDTGLFPRISSSPRPAQPPVHLPTTPSSHFSLAPGLTDTMPVAAGPDQFQFATAPGFEAGHTQWSSLANDPELFAWARSFLNEELDFTMPGASFG